MNECYEFAYEGEYYKIIFFRDKKLKRSARLELVNGELVCRMSLRFDKRQAIAFIEKKKPSLVLLLNRQVAITNDEVFIFGEAKEVVKINEKKHLEGLGVFNNEKELQQLLKKALLKYVESSYKYWIAQMGMNDLYKCTVRDMKTRYGSISKKTNRIAISLKLVHYAPYIIDSIIVHELAHTRYFDHSAAFYKEVYKYCPNYKIIQRKLKRGEFN